MKFKTGAWIRKGFLRDYTIKLRSLNEPFKIHNVNDIEIHERESETYSSGTDITVILTADDVVFGFDPKDVLYYSYSEKEIQQ